MLMLENCQLRWQAGLINSSWQSPVSLIVASIYVENENAINCD